MTRQKDDLAPASGLAHQRVYEALRNALIGGQFVPGRGVTLRGLAQDLGVSPMPVREAIRRLEAERALEIGGNRRVYVPQMTRAKFDELVLARCLLEPEAAVRAMPLIDEMAVRNLKTIDETIDEAIARGDADAYVHGNHAFHFTIYRTAESPVLVPLIEGLWLQFGPFMRTVYGRLGTANVVDHHVATLAALRAGDEKALRAAIRDDILDGMNLIGNMLLEQDGKAGQRT